MRRFATAFLLMVATHLHAASSYPSRYQWKTITTEHFLVHFPQGEEALAHRAAGYAEDAHKQLSPLLGWSPRERTHLILTDHVDAANGSANPFPSNRIEVYVSTPGANPVSSIGDYDDWLRLVIHHEYTHILHLDQARGFSGTMRKVFGRIPLLAFPETLSPLWMIEGLATLAESETTDAGRLKGTFLDMILRTAAIENRFASESEANGLGPFWPGGNSRYFYGARFLSWLSTNRGADKLTQYLHDYSRAIPFHVNGSARNVYGQSMKSLWLEWNAEQQRLYKADRDRLAADGLTDRQRLTTLGYETFHPLLSPDGTRIAYSHRGPYERPTLRIRDVATGKDVRVRTVSTPTTVSWSADGKSIAYSDLELVESVSVLSDLYIWDLDGDRSRRITQSARLKDPAFTPDGRALIAVSNSLGRNSLVEVDVDTGSTRGVLTPDDDRQFDEPVVSHDGTRIAVAEWRNGSTQVVLYDRSGRLISNLTERFATALNSSPRFSSDDRELWFSSDVTGVTNLYAVPAAGGEIRRLTNVYGGAFYPTSTDGRRFFYSDYSAAGFDLATFDAARAYPTVARTIPLTVMGRQPAASTPPSARTHSSEPTPYSPWRSLRPRWWFPILGSSTVDGKSRPQIGFVTSGSDALNRHAYEATVTNHAYSLLYAYDRFYPKLTVGAARYDDEVARFRTPSAERTYSETTSRFLAEVSVPWRKVAWQLEATAGLIRDSIAGHTDGPISPLDLDRIGAFSGTLQGIRLGASFNDAHQFPFSISPEGGVNASVNYENLSRALGSDRSLQQFRGDLRGYLTIPWKRTPLGRHVLALRAAGGGNTGNFVFQRELRVGGIGLGDRATLDNRSFPVRGYENGILRGQRAAVASLEYRFPILEIERGPATFPLFFNRLHGDVFLDAGRVWRQRTGRDTYNSVASTGAEVSLDFVLGDFFPIRYRMGAAYLLRTPGKGEVHPYLAIGSSF